MRKILSQDDPELTIEASLRFAVIAAAANTETYSWCKDIGDWATYLAFQEIPDEDTPMLLSLIRHLCHIDPNLWSTCSQAEAALTSLVKP